jgi:leucyl-tRNA synthetase
MGVPCGDERDFRFAQHFNLPITNIIGKYYDGREANPTKDAILENSDFLNGLVMRDAIDLVIRRLEDLGIGTRKVNYKIRDAAFSRQRYWGEPIPIVWKEGIAYPLDEKDLPLKLPHVESYKPGPEGEGPLSNVESWTARHLETNTMPGYAGSSWYFLRFMDPHNPNVFCSRAASDYWNQVDLYIGGTEHAVGHLLYSRMWAKALFDLGHTGQDEPYRKLLNQGMIQGSSRFVYRVDIPIYSGKPIFISHKYFEEFNQGELKKKELVEFVNKLIPGLQIDLEEGLYSLINLTSFHVDVNIVDGTELDIDAFRKWRPEYQEALFICEDGSLNEAYSTARSTRTDAKYICGSEVEKMSKSKFNTINPDHLVTKYGADTFRMYEMFLGPIDQSKPWDTKGIEGVHRFLKKLWRLFYDDIKGKTWTEEKATEPEWKILHRTIRKVEEDTERFSFNTAVSAFMIAVNDLSDLKCHKKEILEPLLIILAPYAPHICEELYHELISPQSGGGGADVFIVNATFPHTEEKYLTESSKNYPIAINGRTRAELTIALDASQEQVEAMVMTNETVKKWLEGKPVKKLIYIKGKMINIVV